MLRYILPLLLLAGPALAQNEEWAAFQMWRDGCQNPNFPQNEEEKKFCEGFNYAMYYVRHFGPDAAFDGHIANDKGLRFHSIPPTAMDKIQETLHDIMPDF